MNVGLSLLSKLINRNSVDSNKKGAGSISQPLFSMAGGRGVEPRFAESESGVLPLNDPPIFSQEFGAGSSDFEIQFARPILSLKSFLINT